MNSKICGRCKIHKDYSLFHKRKNSYQTWCKICRKEVDKIYWKVRTKNSEKMELKKEYRNKKRDLVRQYIFKFLEENPCVDCFETNPIVLTFDHIKEKSFNISDKIKLGNLEIIKNEIKKCVVRCANCHMKKTAKDFNWYSYRFLNK